MVNFRKKESAFLNKYEICRMATVGNAVPHIVPICYMLINGHFYLATDYDTKKYRNLVKNRSIALVIDVYQPNKAVVIQGEAELIDEGKEFRQVYRKFYRKFAWVRDTPWNEREAPFIKVKPLVKISWGLE